MALVHLQLDYQEECPLNNTMLHEVSLIPPEQKRGHICAIDMQHVDALMADYRVASLAPCVLVFFVIQKFDTATIGDEGREASV